MRNKDRVQILKPSTPKDATSLYQAIQFAATGEKTDTADVFCKSELEKGNIDPFGFADITVLIKTSDPLLYDNDGELDLSECDKGNTLYLDCAEPKLAISVRKEEDQYVYIVKASVLDWRRVFVESEIAEDRRLKVLLLLMTLWMPPLFMDIYDSFDFNEDEDDEPGNLDAESRHMIGKAMEEKVKRAGCPVASKQKEDEEEKDKPDEQNSELCELFDGLSEFFELLGDLVKLIEEDED